MTRYANWQSGEVESLVFVGSTPTLVTVMQTIGQLLLKAGKVDEAESVLLESLDVYRKIQPNHPNRSTVLRFCRTVDGATRKVGTSRGSHSCELQ